VQVTLSSSEGFGPETVRELASSRVMKLVQLPGIVTSASKPRHKATHITVQCKDCRNVLTVPCKPGMGGAVVPRQCTVNQGDPSNPNERCGYGSFVVLGDRSEYVDQQTLKLQERPEDVPTGELPRALLCVADRLLVGRVTPGTRVLVTGIYCTHRPQAMGRGAGAGNGPGAAGATLQQPYLRLTSIVDQSEAHASAAFSSDEVASFEAFARAPRAHERIFAQIAPKIYGSEDVKRAVACLLFGGARKVMPDGTARRGDVNVLLLGDPSTAKSQFLKFVDKVAPICVYTSGKGSSAAGLTAAVIQDGATREFYLEGGAMVLADGGVVCIDEFDKMRPEDRVAIHEAMEQQTISIAKAGITTVLKSRTSVLAAANPPSGRYDDLRSTSDNIDLQSTILSRFDLIFIVRDGADAERDMAIARHVLGVHQNASGAAPGEGDGPAGRRAANAAGAAAGPNGAAAGGGDGGATSGPDGPGGERWLRRYIHYCRTRCFPRLDDGARGELVAKYVEIRDRARQAARAEGGGGSSGAGAGAGECPIPITVRQLEALVRISESLARMQLRPVATAEHVAVAFELFRASTMNAINAGLANAELGGGPAGAQTAEVQAVEARIRDRIPHSGHASFRRILDDVTALGYGRAAVALAVKVMVERGELRRRAEGKLLQRVR
jgi:DNA replication licensing factor MCM5